MPINRLVPFTALAAVTALASPATAQLFCSDNLFPVHLVDAAGVELPLQFDPVLNADVFVAPTEQVYLAFDPNLASGTYYVHVTDTPIDGMDEVLSQNDPMDRFVHVENSGGVITLSLPFSSNPSAAVYGLGLGGVGQSILLNPFSRSQFSQCRFKAWYGDVWDLGNGPANPYLLAGGIHPVTGNCAVRSYHSFRVGDGDGSDVCGTVFGDTNQNGVHDPGEPGLANWEVSLVTPTSSTPALTDGEGNYCFPNIDAGSYSVELTLRSGYVATTSIANPIEACACAPVAGGAFGVATAVLACDARTIGYWRNKHGLALVQQFNILSTLPALCIVNTCGQQVAPGSLAQFKCWLRNANAWNMAYMLSAQLVAMHCNVIVGYVDPACVIEDPCLGAMTVADLMQQAIASLCAHPYTPPCSPHRHEQSRLKNALDRANNNLIWQ